MGTPVQLAPRVFAPEINPNAKKTCYKHLVDYAGTANGAFRILQLMDKVNRVVVEALISVGSTLKDAFEGFGKKLTVAWTMLAIPHLFGVWKKCKESVQTLTSPILGERAVQIRTATEATRDIAETAAVSLYVASMVTGNNTLKICGDIPDLVTNVIDGQTAAQDWNEARKASLIANIPVETQTALVGTQRYAFLKLVKSVCSIATGVLGLSVLALGGPVLPAIVLLMLSLASTAFSMASHFYKETAAYQPIKFFENRNVQPLAPVAS